MTRRTIREAAAALREGGLTSVGLLEECLARIDRYEDRVRAWVLVDRDGARRAAARADAELKAGTDRGPLHGIPVGVKDIIDVFDLPTACGSALWKDSVARHDAPCVARLREAGAVLVGKTVTTQYASFDPPPTRNPWDPTRTPGGSSSGSAAAVATGMCLAALGSQTGGSITRPATYCGVAAVKPGYGAVSTVGVLPLAASMDHVGAMANTVADVEAVFRAIAKPGRIVGASDPGRPPVIGRPAGFFTRHADEAVRVLMDEVFARAAESGAVVLDVGLPASFGDVVPRHRVVMAVEAAMVHRERRARHPDDYGPCITQLLREGIDCPATVYAECKRHQRRLRVEMHDIFKDIDALLCPATTRSAPDAATTGDPAFNSPWSYTGLPAVSFPVRLGPDGLPLGVQFVAPLGRAFAAAAWGEAAFGGGVGEPPL